MDKIVLQFCIDEWLTVRLQVNPDDEFVNELCCGGHVVDNNNVIHVQSAGTSEAHRCGWYAARRILDKYAPQMPKAAVDYCLYAGLDDTYLRHEHMLGRGICDLGFPKLIVEALLQRNIETLEQLIKGYWHLDSLNKSRLAYPRSSKSTAIIQLGERRLDIIRKRLKKLGVLDLANSMSHPVPDLSTRMLIAERSEHRTSMARTAAPVQE